MATRSASAFRTPLRKARFVLPLLCLLLLLAADASAQVKRWVQPDSVPPLKRIYNVAGDEFITGILFNKYFQESSDTTVGVFWEFARWMNASDWIGTSGFQRGTSFATERAAYLRQMDTLALLAEQGERFIGDISPVAKVGFAKMMEIYPFDSVQSPYARWEFVDVDAASTPLFATMGGATLSTESY